MLIAVSFLGFACAPNGSTDPSLDPATSQPSEQSSSQAVQAAVFRDVAREVGIDFRHTDGRTGQRFYVETASGGGGWFDYDGDGDLDLYLLNGAQRLNYTRALDASEEADDGEPPRNALFENRSGRFVDVTSAAGVGDTGFGMGLCVGDVDADGHLDLFVTNYGPDRLYRNLGADAAGTVRFEEIGETVGIGGDRWGTNCTFADIDNDGDLDLYVVNYVDFDFEANPRCGDPVRGLWSYCRPDVFDGQADSLYINDGVDSDGLPRFRDQAAERGIAAGRADKGFGVVASDLDSDGDVDLVVANDGTRNRLYVNDGTGQFTDAGLLAGVALDRDGRAQAGMGLDLGDADGDGLLDLVVTNYAYESITLYRNRGDMLFEDRTVESGLAEETYLPVGWGVRLVDFDNDSDLDLVVANGHVMDNIEDFEPLLSYPQPDLLFENDGSGHFERVLAPRAGDLSSSGVSRALATGDFDDDGRVDLLVTRTNASPVVLRNERSSGRHWLGIRLIGPPSNRQALGARVRLLRGDRLIGVGEVRSGGSLMAQSDLRLHFGLGDDASSVDAEIRWPDGQIQQERFESLDRYVDVQYNGP